MDIKSARGILLNVTDGIDLSLHEINDAANLIYEESNKDAHIIVGSVIDPDMGDELIVSVIATGFNQTQAATPMVQTEKPAMITPIIEQKKLYEEPELAKIVLEVPEQRTDNLEVPAYLRTQEFTLQSTDEQR